MGVESWGQSTLNGPVTHPTMHPRAEWLFMAALVLLCGILTAVQYRWTGDLARAEAERLGGNFAGRVQQLCQELDAELVRLTDALIPTGQELVAMGMEKAHRQSWQRWQDLLPQPVFARIAIVVRAGSGLRYHEQNLQTGAVSAAQWPADWGPLRENLEGKIKDGSPQFSDPWGLVYEAPIFVNGTEAEWVIFEIDEKHLRTVWLPALVQEHLMHQGQPLGEVSLTAKAEPTKILYASGTGLPPGGPVVVQPLNRYGRAWMGMRHRPSTSDNTAWKMQALRTPAALDRIVSASRLRNLGIAVLLNGLIVAAGLLLVRHTRKARELAQRQMDFVATVSHELRTPLTVIKGAAHNLQRGVVRDPERTTQYLDLISQNAGQLGEMVEQVLAYAGTQRPGQPTRQPVQLRDELQAAITACEADIQAARCVVEAHISPELPLIQGDAAALRRVFQNLITNAAKHAGSGHWIGITAQAIHEDTAHQIEVSVADHGPGIPLEEQAAVFQPFVRGQATMAAQTRGSGIGLSLVREIVREHGGAVTLRSTEDAPGSTFTVRLPVS